MRKSYLYGLGVPQDFKQAEEWFQKAAEFGDAASQYALGTMYKSSKDLVEAHKWFNIANAHGFAPAEKDRQTLEAEMTPEQIREAQQRASKWMESRK